jgi:shikimate kinase
MQSRIFLIGFMGSGKSTVGLKLAGRIGYDFVDMDLLITETAGMTIPGIFNEYGEEVFRKWEHDILIELCQRNQVVVSTGGGAPCHGEMISIMNAHGITVYIKLTPAALKERLLHSRTERPLIRGKSESELMQFITSLLAQREVYYSRATHTVDGLSLDLEHLVDLLSRS